MKAAIATFVKTPGISPLKTRLGKTIGQNRAEDFYRFAIQQTEKMVKEIEQEVPEVTAYWAVAEEQAFDNELWQGLPTISQGEGGLGDRLHKVYSDLLKENDAVFLYGADSPHIKSSVILEAYHALESYNFVVGPTEDGGFYIFGGNQEISLEDWNSVQYSCDETLGQLLRVLTSEVAMLGPEFDIDTEEELRRLTQIDSRYSQFLS